MNLKPVYLLHLLLFCGPALFSQNYFNRIYPGASPDWGPVELVGLDSGYVTMDNVIFREYDLQGNPVDSVFHNILPKPIITGYGLIALPGQRFIHGYSSFGYKVGLLMKYDNKGAVVQMKSYSCSGYLTTSPFSIKADSDSTFIMSGTVSNSSSPQNETKIFYARVDTSFNVLWERVYEEPDPVPGRKYFEPHIWVEPTGYAFGFSVWYYNGQFRGKGLVLKTDLSGNPQWITEIKTPNGEIVTPSLEKQSNGNYIFLAAERMDTNNRTSNYDPMVHIYGTIDPNGQLLTQKRLGPVMNFVSKSAFTRTYDQNFVMGGLTHNANDDWTTYLIKFTENGDPVWQREYFHNSPQKQSWAFSIVQTADSGLVMGGVFMEDFNQAPFTWLLRLDQYGCNTANCSKVGVPEVDPDSELNVFPNPTRDHFVLEWNDPVGEAVIHIYSSMGRLVYREKIASGTTRTRINTGSWAAGVYYLQMEEGVQNQALRLIKE
ncbi:MAG TPA: hypothetical protein DCG19_15510 [Cryomorphaceae bacterium]|nr:hypothetical protein [Owenweeksia sp.]MBF99177.1 hypothetical protein [Owenweeksia sp.]HAD98820.1 hypothetical protein [Cryomorphaceae bacterium]HBF19304.1 hypothetical protein [Cryomorphaceae bacterium]|tara:strand:+ start:1253 stop:2719 length:1467 start_codon:yes stop_codon:yes gene_type:complete